MQSSSGYVHRLSGPWLSVFGDPFAGWHGCSGSKASLASPLEEGEAVQGTLVVQLQEAREALAHQEADTEAARSEARVLTRQLEVRLGWPPGISTCPFLTTPRTCAPGAS